MVWPLNATYLQLYCYLVTVPPRKPNKIFKVFFEKGSSNVCPISEQPSLYLVTHSSLTRLMWLGSLYRPETLVCEGNTQHSYENHSLWYLNFYSIMNPLNSCAFNILMQLLLKTLIMHFYFLAIPAPPPPFLLHRKGMVAFLCNMLILHGGTWYSKPGNQMEFPFKFERLNLLVFEGLTTLNDKLMISKHLLMCVSNRDRAERWSRKPKKGVLLWDGSWKNGRNQSSGVPHCYSPGGCQLEFSLGKHCKSLEQSLLYWWT